MIYEKYLPSISPQSIAKSIAVGGYAMPFKRRRGPLYSSSGSDSDKGCNSIRKSDIRQNRCFFEVLSLADQNDENRRHLPGYELPVLSPAANHLSPATRSLLA